jgi:hypothetical protein
MASDQPAKVVRIIGDAIPKWLDTDDVDLREWVLYLREAAALEAHIAVASPRMKLNRC